MPVLVPELEASYDNLRKEAQARGLRVLEFAGAGDVPIVELKASDLPSLLESAVGLGARGLYLLETRVRDPDAPAEAGGMLEALQRMPARPDAPAASGYRRYLELVRDQRLLGFYACFLQDGVLHRVRVVDALAWDTMRDLEQMTDEEELDDEDDERDEMASLLEMEPERAAEVVVRHLRDEHGLSEREMRRNPRRAVRIAARELVDGLELDEAGRRRLRAIEKAAEERLRTPSPVP